MSMCRISTIGLLQFVAVLTALFCLPLFSSSGWARDDICVTPMVHEGIAQLECWDGSAPIALSGDWHLDFRSDREDRQYDGLAQVPSKWRNLSPPVPITGQGVYRLTLRLSGPLSQQGLKLPRSNMARTVALIDETGGKRVLFDTGNTALSAKSIAPMRMPVIALPTLADNSQLVITVRNSSSVHGGIEDPIVIGPVEVLVRDENLQFIYASILATILAVFFIINSGLWIAGDRNSALILLSTISILSSFRLALVSGLLFEIFPQLTNEFEVATGWASFFGVACAGVYYFWFNYRKLVPKWLPIAVAVCSLIGVGLYLTRPLYEVQEFAVFYRPVLSILMLTLLVYLWHGMREADTVLKFTLAGSSVAVAAIVFDIMYYQVTQSHSLVSISSLGFLVFMATETLMMFRRYSYSISQSEDLAGELRALNASLELKIDERTVELASVNERLVSMAHTDELTGLANRRAFDRALHTEVARADRSGKSLVVGILDLDNLKEVNDEHGHLAGDAVLKGVANILNNSARTTDVSCRWGGDEFSILLPETSKEAAFVVCDRLREAISKQEVSIVSGIIKVTVSIGLAEYSKGQNIEEIIDDADTALYKSKQIGRNQVTGAWVLPS